jgi:hypothetical protein
MSRRIITINLQAAGNAKVDNYFDRVVKYIPSDIVGSWVAVSGIVEGARNDIPADVVLWIVFAFGVLFTIAWTAIQTREFGRNPAYLQVVISTCAFIVWVFAIGGPFKSLTFYNQVYGAIALIGFILLTGLLKPKE